MASGLRRMPDKASAVSYARKLRASGKYVDVRVIRKDDAYYVQTID